MVRTYIKKGDDGKEHVYEERGFFEGMMALDDRDLGELKDENPILSDNYKETKNWHGGSGDIRVEEEETSWGVKTGRRKANVQGESGHFEKDFWGNERFHPEKSESESVDPYARDETSSNSSDDNYTGRSSDKKSSTNVSSNRDSFGIPWQYTLGDFLKSFGLGKFSRFFYSLASEVYAKNDNFYESGKLAVKSGDLESAFYKFSRASFEDEKDWLYEAGKISKNREDKEKFLKIFENYGDRKKRANLAERLGLVEKAVDYFIETCYSHSAEESVEIMIHAGEIAEEIEKPKKAIKAYRLAASRGDLVGEIGVKLRADYALNMAKGLEEILKSEF